MTRSDQNLRHEAIRAECLRLGLDRKQLKRSIECYDRWRKTWNSENAQSRAFALAKHYHDQSENLRLRAGSIQQGDSNADQ